MLYDNIIYILAMPTPMNSSVNQINAIISKEQLHGEIIFYPVEEVQVTLDQISRGIMNKRTPAALLPQHLYMKKSMVPILLRSLSPKQ